MKKTLSKIYDQFASEYNDNRDSFDINSIILDFFAEQQVTQGHLLDLGCGCGVPFAKFFCDRGWQVSGVDFSQRMLDLAGKLVPDMRTIHSDIGSVDFEAESFDSVAAIYSLFHIPRDEHSGLFANISRWLKPGGKFLFTYASEEYTGVPRFDGYKAFMSHDLYYSHDTPEEMQDKLRQAGLNPKKIDPKEIAGETFLWVLAEKSQ